MNSPSWPIEKIIDIANQLQRHGRSAGSTSEVIAAAFVLDRQDLLPQGYTMIQAWDRLGEWQHIVRKIQRDCQHRIDAD